MLRIGLTGGIGCGKSTVANIFSSLGVDIIDADEIVHKISAPGQQCYQAIIKKFGNSFLNSDDTINRQALAKSIFNDDNARKELENILHPAVRDSMKLAVLKVHSPYCILVIPLLVETGFTELVDRVLVVTAEKERRVKWVKNRNGLSEHQIKSIMETQASDKERNDIADDIIENNGTKISLDGQVQKLDHKYRKIAGDPYVKPNT